MNGNASIARKSKEQLQRERANDRNNRWQQANVKKVNIMFNVATNDDDRAAFEWLQKQPNKSGYIKSLLLKASRKDG